MRPLAGRYGIGFGPPPLPPLNGKNDSSFMVLPLLLSRYIPWSTIDGQCRPRLSPPLSLFMSVSSIFVRRIRWNHWCGGVFRGQAVYITIPRRCPARCHLIRLQNLIDIEMFVLCVLYKMLRSIITGSWWHVYCCFRLIVHCYR